MSQFAMDVQHDLNRAIDREVLSQYSVADWDVDDGDIGGTNGVSAVISPTNINRVFSAAARKLTKANVKLTDRFAVISPTVLEQIQLYTAGKDTQFGDTVMNNGYVGERFGFRIHVSNDLTSTATWTPANQPSDGDTVTINGVVFTFETGTPTNAGDVKSETSLAVTLDNLVASVNAPGTSVSGTFVAVSAADQVTLEGLTMTDGTTLVTVVYKGSGEVTYAASEANDPWSLQTIHCLFGKVGATDLVIQKQPNIQVKDVQDKLGVNVMAYTLFGLKTFDVGDAQLVDVKIDMSNF